MSRTKLPLPQESIAPFDLETFMKEAATLNQRALEAFTLAFPKGPQPLAVSLPMQASPDQIHDCG